MDVLEKEGLPTGRDGNPLPLLFVHPASPAQGEAFFQKRWPGARAIADPHKELFTAFGLKRGNPWQLFGPKVFWGGIKGMFAGYGAAPPQGDPWLLGGQFLMAGEHLLWARRLRHAGDPLDWGGVEDALSG